jgi:hypothetical protein
LSAHTAQPLHIAVLTNDAQLIHRIVLHQCPHVNVFHNSQRERLLPAFKLVNPESKSWSLEGKDTSANTSCSPRSNAAGLLNLSRDSVLVIHSAEELSKKEVFGVKQVVSRGVMGESIVLIIGGVLLSHVPSTRQR